MYKRQIDLVLIWCGDDLSQLGYFRSLPVDLYTIERDGHWRIEIKRKEYRRISIGAPPTVDGFEQTVIGHNESFRLRSAVDFRLRMRLLQHQFR